MKFLMEPKSVFSDEGRLFHVVLRLQGHSSKSSHEIQLFNSSDVENQLRSLEKVCKKCKFNIKFPQKLLERLHAQKIPLKLSKVL